MHYPTTDELLSSLGLQRLPPTQTTAMTWITPVAIFGAGLVAGAVSAVLVTPKAGREVRSDLRDAAGQAGHTIRNAASRAGEYARAALPPFDGSDSSRDTVAAGDNHTGPPVRAQAPPTVV